LIEDPSAYELDAKGMDPRDQRCFARNAY